MSTSKAMTQHSTQWLSQTINYARLWLITTNSSSHQSNYSRMLSKHCSGQIIYNYSRILFTKDNNSRIVQGSLLFSTVSLLTWFQSKFNTKQQQFKIVGRSYQHKIQSLPSTCLHLIPCCIL